MAALGPRFQHTVKVWCTWAGAELLTTYGPSFWLGGAAATPPLTPRAAALQARQQVRVAAAARAAVRDLRNAAAAAALSKGLAQALEWVRGDLEAG